MVKKTKYRKEIFHFRFRFFFFQDENSYSVRLEYLNGTNKRSTDPIRIAGCPDDQCSLDHFRQVYETKLPVQMENECRSRKVKRK